jgi:hypothetical protein
MAELKKVARGKSAFTGYMDKVTTNHGCTTPESNTSEGVWQVTVGGFPIAYDTARVREHDIKIGKNCIPHAPTIKATCQSVLVGTPEEVLKPIAREDDKTLDGNTGDPFPGSGGLAPDVVGPVQQSGVWVGV